MTIRSYTNRRYLDALNQRIMVFDGAMGTSLQTMNLTPEQFGGSRTFGCNDFLVISHPESVEKVHRSFLQVGVDVLETDTFRANRLTLADYELAGRVHEINRAAASLARRLADEYSTSHQPRFVAGSIGPSGKLPSMDDPELSNISFAELADIFREQALGLIEGGVDLIIIETSQDILEVKAAIIGIQNAFEESKIHLPIQAQVTLDTTGRMLLGTDITAVLAILERLPIDVIGLNCSTGPDFMREPVRFLGENSTLPVSCIPNAGLPLNIDGKAVYPLQPEPFAETLVEYIQKYHIQVVGGCCGTTPDHLASLIEKIKNLKPVARPDVSLPRLASAIQAVPMHQDPPPFLIGERLNTQGSRKFKQLILNEDFDSILAIAGDQINNGAHGLDLCVALTERTDEAYLVHKVVKKLSLAAHVPLIIDSTEPDVIETALQTAPGRCLINSANLEGGRAKADKIFSLAKKYNAAVIVLTIDEKGMAKTASKKLEIARRIYDLAVNEHGLKPDDLVFDALTFTLATGDPEYNNSAIETIQGISEIKAELPGVLTSLGVSNVSFGFSPSARPVINSVMLYHCVQAGLDMAIVNPAQITPYADISTHEKELAEDLILNRNPGALQHLIEYFHKNQNAPNEKMDQHKLTLEALTAEGRLHWRILHRDKEDVEKDIEEIFRFHPDTSRHQTSIQILNQVLLPAMKEVGEKFGSGELILPFVLQSAEVMKKCVSYLESFLDKQEGSSKGTIVLATVYGDVHDIGKNLVKTILSNNGYKIIDLGKQVPAETIISSSIENKADAIGLSALLVSTSKQMPLIVNELQRRRLDLPVLIGGAAINQRFGRRILLTEQGEIYDPGVFYCKDAFEGLAAMDALTNPEQRPRLLAKIRREAEIELGREARPRNEPEVAHPTIPPALKIPISPAWGVRHVASMPLDIVFQHLSKKELYRLSWGAKHTHGEDWEALEKEFDARLEQMRQEVLKEKWLQPQGVYGYWPSQSSGDDLILYDPASVEAGASTEIARFRFARQIKGEYICLADYFASVESGIMDIVALQIVTIGQGATLRIDRLQEEGKYSDAYFTHGLAVQMAEATADYLHNHIRRELGIANDQGKRYSWGFPAIPNLEDHARVFQLLPAESLLGMKLTTAYQLVPEQSTAAIIVHHPLAKYYDIGETRIEQLMR
jgi:5-methyltetrahydrofolate--homocysteine methyltransferase